jgi:hypothetical protein
VPKYRKSDAVSWCVDLILPTPPPSLPISFLDSASLLFFFLYTTKHDSETRNNAATETVVTMAAVLATLTLPLLLEGCVADWDDTSAAVVGVGRVAVWEGGEGGKNKSGEVGTDGSENSGEDGGGVHWMGNNGSWRILSRFAKD